MSPNGAPPTFHGNNPVIIRKTVVEDLPCPKCNKPVKVSGIAVGSLIECASCSNMFWLPLGEPKWWYNTKKFAMLLVGEFIVAMIVGALLASIYGGTQQ